MKEITINSYYQSLAIRQICCQYVAEIANARYKQIIEEIQTNEVISKMVSLIGERIERETTILQVEIKYDIENNTDHAYFNNYRYCLSNSRELIIALAQLMNW